MSSSFEQGIERGSMETALNNAKSIMAKLDMSLEEALDILNVNEKVRQYILENIEK